jgi:hypothetical protein
MVRSGDMYSPWLSEGLTEYSSRLYGYELWPARFQNYLYETNFQAFQSYVDPAAEVPLTGPGIFTDDSTVYYFITYQKGAQVMRSLQWLLGDEAFFAGMADYAHKHVWSVDNPLLVDVPALQAALEAASGQELTSFFEQWVYSTGYPIYRWSTEFGGDAQTGWSARVRVEQVQTTGVLYELPVEVAIWVGDEAEPRSFRAEFAGAVADATFPLDAEPRGLRVDNGRWLWADRMPALTGDVDCSNEVDGLDLIYEGWSLGSLANDPYEGQHYLSESDFDRDGIVDETDLDTLLAQFGAEGSIDG